MDQPVDSTKNWLKLKQALLAKIDTSGLEESFKTDSIFHLLLLLLSVFCFFYSLHNGVIPIFPSSHRLHSSPRRKLCTIVLKYKMLVLMLKYKKRWCESSFINILSVFGNMYILFISYISAFKAAVGFHLSRRIKTNYAQVSADVWVHMYDYIDHDINTKMTFMYSKIGSNWCSTIHIIWILTGLTFQMWLY